MRSSQLHGLLGLALLLVIFLGCVQTTIPSMPVLTTQKEKDFFFFAGGGGIMLRHG